MRVVVERGDVGEVDPGYREAAPAIEGGHGREHEGPDRGEEDGGIERLGRRVVGSLGRGASERERQLTGVGVPRHHVHRRPLVQGDLGREVGRAAEAVDAEPAARRQGALAAARGSR